jgi:hypothetical protein
MHSSIIVKKAAPDPALVTLHEAKTALQLPTNVTTGDEALRQMILRSSDEVQTLCSRVFPKETVIETFRECDNPISRLYLSRYPVQPLDIVSITADGSALDLEYDIDVASGKLSLWGGNIWASSLTVEYAGGYEIPNGVPYALRQAVLLFIRDAYHTAARGDSSIRQISHKESRISYFDQSKADSGASGGGVSAAQKAATSLLQRYTRLIA